MEFNKRIAKLYPELFGEGDKGGTDERAGFSRKWGAFSEIYCLSGQDITKFNEVAKLPVHKCLMYLAFEKDKAEFEARMIKNKFR